MSSISDKAVPINVGIVDDSRSIRRWLRSVLDADDRLQVVAEAANGREAREMLRRTKIDVMTLDVDMPGMTGIEFLSRLMRHHPMPVVMVSALTEAGSREAVEALSLGAVDCIEKPRSVAAAQRLQDICDRVWQAAQSQVSAITPRARTSPPKDVSSDRTAWKGPIILLGASTGGVSALETVLTELEGNPTPVLIAQHMPENFLRSFSRRFDEQFSRHVSLAEDNLIITANQAVISVGRDHSTYLRKKVDGTLVCHFREPSSSARHHPNVDDLFQSAASENVFGCAALLTGMGSDGAKGLLDLKKRGLTTWAQNEDTSVVYGMPKAAVDLSAADHVESPQNIGRAINSLTLSLLEREISSR